jgi:hypothetical protein
MVSMRDHMNETVELQKTLQSLIEKNIEERNK